MHDSPQSTTSHQLFRLRFTELNEIYAMMSLRTFGLSLIGIFIPIYLYVNHYSLQQILLIYLIMYSTEIFFEYLTAHLIRILGPKHSIAFSVPFMIAHFWFLQTISTYHWSVFPIAITGGISLALYWQAYHYDFSLSKHRRKATHEVSNIYILLAIMSALAPFLGGVIATNFGTDSLYFMVLVILSLCVLPLLKTSEPVKPRGVFDLGKIKLQDIRRDIISYIGDGWEGTTVATLWPLFVFLIVKNYQSVGFLTSVALIITVIVTYYVGKQGDKRDRSKFIRTSGYLSGLLNSLQIFAYTASHVMFLNLGRNLADSLGNAPYVSEYYLHADENSRSEYLFIMESAIDLGRIILFGILLIISFYADIHIVLIAALVIGGIGSILFTLMPKAKCEICHPSENKAIRVTSKIAKIANSESLS